MILAKKRLYLLHKYSIVITFLLIVHFQRIQNVPVNHSWKNSSSPHAQPALVKGLTSTPKIHVNKEVLRETEVRRGVDIDVHEATKEPDTQEDFIQELEDELNEDLSSSNPMSSSSENFHSESSNSEEEETSEVSSLTTTPCSSCKKVVDENKFLRQEIETLIFSNSTDETGDCVGCKALAMENLVLKEKAGVGSSFTTGNIRPAFPCDDWDGVTRTCYLDRNIGDTVTFVLAFHKRANPEIQWAQEFHLYNSKKKKQYIIDPENPLWNIVIGSRGHEMRISPITEIDIDFNYFSATIINYYAKLHKKRIGKAHPMDTLNFRIRVMPTDLGFVYPGETLMLNMKRISLPSSNMKFKWYLEKDGEYSRLPSNMRLSPTGGVLTVSELRKEQEGILACAVFTNMGFFATKERFLVKEMNHTHNMLLYVPTRPGLNGRRKRSVDSDNYIATSKGDSENSDVVEGIEDDYVTDIHLYHEKRQVNDQQNYAPQNINQQQYFPQNANQQQYPPPQNPNEQQYSPVQNPNEQQYSPVQNPNEQQYSAAQIPGQQQYSPQNLNQQQYSPAQNLNQQQYSPAQNPDQQQYSPPQSPTEQQYSPAQNPEQQQYSPPQNPNEQQYSPAQNTNQQQYSPPQSPNEQQYSPVQNTNQQPYSPPQSINYQQNSPPQTASDQQYSAPQNYQQYSALQNANNQQNSAPPYASGQQYSAPQNANYQQYPVPQSAVLLQPQSVPQYQDENNQMQPQVAQPAENVFNQQNENQNIVQQAPPPVPQNANVQGPQAPLPAENIFNQQNTNPDIAQQAPPPGESPRLVQYPDENLPQKEYNPNQQEKGVGKPKSQELSRYQKPLPGKGKILPKLKEKKEEIILELERKQVISLLQKAQDRLSKMIANCTTDQHCAADASCIQHNPRIAGFCRCSTGFQGNGIFCWEEIKVRNLFSKNQRTENDQRGYLTEETTEEITTEGKFLFKRHTHG
ncbi:hypothetical protein AVEN_168244-1 [Araneus ventricosus]|uniref:EGF-like domain-containing protein n=1 Tax=Araneus ventricosus TaxID=182803 RepID=A0A4Y2J494_ARAVE|nr:hypothetical protein AVEN_168244-1 [Araneus ventricosus]